MYICFIKSNLTIVLLCVINAGYGGGFSNLPTLLADRFGLASISTMHGLALSAWAFAGLSGAFVLDKTGSYEVLLYVLMCMFAVATAISMWVVKPGRVRFVNASKAAQEKVAVN